MPIASLCIFKENDKKIIISPPSEKIFGSEDNSGFIHIGTKKRLKQEHSNINYIENQSSFNLNNTKNSNNHNDSNIPYNLQNILSHLIKM